MYKDIVSIQEHATDLDAIINSIRNILLTMRGSLPGKPRFGSDLYKVIFRPLDSLTTAMAKRYVKEALTEFEDRIIVKDIKIKREEAFNKIIINITFAYKDNDFGTETNTSSVAVSFNL